MKSHNISDVTSLLSDFPNDSLAPIPESSLLPTQTLQVSSGPRNDQGLVQQNRLIVDLPTPYRNADNALVITSVLGPPQERQSMENLLYPGVELGLKGYDRAHSQGPGTGNEFSEGILYAPQSVNRGDQNQGIERYLRELQAAKREGVEFILVTETKAHEGTMRLQSINYRLDVVENGKRSRLLETSLDVGRDVENPTVQRGSVDLYDDIDRYIRPSARPCDVEASKDGAKEPSDALFDYLASSRIK